MDLPLSADLFPKAKLPEAVAAPREHFSEILLLLLLLIGFASLHLLGKHAHLFGPRGWHLRRLPLLLLGGLRQSFMSSTHFIHL